MEFYREMLYTFPIELASVDTITFINKVMWTCNEQISNHLAGIRGRTESRHDFYISLSTHLFLLPFIQFGRACEAI